MVLRRLRNRSKPTKARPGDAPGVEERSREDNRQHEMSEPAQWLVPDKGDDIVVSRRNDD